jgi:hypothetical protein
MNSSSMPTSLIIPVSPPTAAPTAIPRNGTKKVLALWPRLGGRVVDLDELLAGQALQGRDGLVRASRIEESPHPTRMNWASERVRRPGGPRVST